MGDIGGKFYCERLAIMPGNQNSVSQASKGFLDRCVYLHVEFVIEILAVCDAQLDDMGFDVGNHLTISSVSGAFILLDECAVGALGG